MKNNIRPQARPVRYDCKFRHFKPELTTIATRCIKKNTAEDLRPSAVKHINKQLGADDADAGVSASGRSVKDAKGVL